MTGAVTSFISKLEIKTETAYLYAQDLALDITVHGSAIQAVANSSLSPTAMSNILPYHSYKFHSVQTTKQNSSYKHQHPTVLTKQFPLIYSKLVKPQSCTE